MLTTVEQFALEMLQDKDAEAQRQSQGRMVRFLGGISERTGIPVDALNVNPQTGEIIDTRMRSEPLVEGVGEDE